MKGYSKSICIQKLLVKFQYQAENLKFSRQALLAVIRTVMNHINILVETRESLWSLERTLDRAISIQGQLFFERDIAKYKISDVSEENEKMRKLLTDSYYILREIATADVSFFQKNFRQHYLANDKQADDISADTLAAYADLGRKIYSSASFMISSITSNISFLPEGRQKPRSQSSCQRSIQQLLGVKNYPKPSSHSKKTKVKCSKKFKPSLFAIDDKENLEPNSMAEEDDLKQDSVISSVSEQTKDLP